VDIRSFLITFNRVQNERLFQFYDVCLKKEKIEARLKKRFSPEDVNALIDAIGRDTFFRSGKKRDEQSIRHHLWKVKKGILFLQKIHHGAYRDYLHNASERDADCDALVARVAMEAALVLHTIDQLEVLYQEALRTLEYALRNPRSIDAYWSSARREQEFISQLIERYEGIPSIAEDIKIQLKRVAMLIRRMNSRVYVGIGKRPGQFTPAEVAIVRVMNILTACSVIIGSIGLYVRVNGVNLLSIFDESNLFETCVVVAGGWMFTNAMMQFLDDRGIVKHIK
jgi:hypothetical protein